MDKDNKSKIVKKVAESKTVKKVTESTTVKKVMEVLGDDDFLNVDYSKSKEFDLKTRNQIKKE